MFKVFDLGNGNSIVLNVNNIVSIYPFKSNENKDCGTQINCVDGTLFVSIIEYEFIAAELTGVLL